MPPDASLITEQIETSAPSAPRKPHVEERFGEKVTDDYFWLRDQSDPDVIRDLEAENEYTRRETATSKPFVDKLYGEMLSRLKQTDLSVPVRRGQYLYYYLTEEVKHYPMQCRRKRDMAAPEDFVLDRNILALGHKFMEVA